MRDPHIKIPLFNLAGQYGQVQSAIHKRIRRIFKSNQFILGKNVRTLETAVAKKIGARYAVALASGSDALYLALAALGIGGGDEVITTPFTFFATAGAISRTGAKPVFADIDPTTFNIDPAEIRKKITRKTAAILPVHLFGLACNMDKIMRLAKENKLVVVEDAAQSFGARYKGRQTGSIGDAGCFSFYPTKNLGAAGDAGMVVTSSKGLEKKIRILRDHGSTQKYYHKAVGINSRLDEIQAAVLVEKLRFIDDWNEKRRRLAVFYNDAFQGLPMQTPPCPEGGSHVFHLYSVVTERRDALSAFLLKNAIGTGVYYPLALHLQPCFSGLGYQKGDCPVAEKITGQVLSLPMYPDLSPKARSAVVDCVRNFFQG